MIEEVARLVRLRQRFTRRLRRTRRRCCRPPRRRARSRNCASAWSIATTRKSITFSFVSSAWEHALRDRDPAADQGAEPDREPPGRDAHDACSAGCSTRCAPTSTAKPSACAIFEIGRCFLRERRALRPAAAHRRPRLRARPIRRNGTAANGRSTSSTSRATSRRWPPRCTLTTVAAAASGAASGALGARCWSADSRSAGWANCIPRLSREFELPRAPIVFELDSDPLTAAADARGAQPSPSCRWFAATSRWSSTRRCPRTNVLAALQALNPPQVEQISLFDVYKGPGCRTR